MPDFVLYRITIEMVLDGSGDQVVQAQFEDVQDPDVGMPPIVPLLGMLELTKDTAIKVSAGEHDGE